MSEYLIVCRNMTHAQRAERLFRRSGRKAAVKKIKSGLGREGCSYAVFMTGADWQDTVRYLRENNIEPLAAFAVMDCGMYEELCL